MENNNIIVTSVKQTFLIIVFSSIFLYKINLLEIIAKKIFNINKLMNIWKLKKVTKCCIRILEQRKYKDGILPFI